MGNEELKAALIIAVTIIATVYVVNNYAPSLRTALTPAA